MAKQTINIGTSANKGDGDPLRTAFTKINNNFDELYAKDATDIDLSAIDQSIIPDTNEAYDLGSATNRFRDLYLSGTTIYLGDTPLSIDNGTLLIDGVAVSGTDGTGDVKGSIFADDSTLLVDAVNASIPYSVLSGAPTIPTDISDLTDTTNLLFDGDYGSLSNTPAIPTLTSQLTNDSGFITAADIAGGTLTIDVNNTGDLQGSVFADDSTLLVDSVSGVLRANINTPADFTITVDSGDSSPQVWQFDTGGVLTFPNGQQVDAEDANELLIGTPNAGLILNSQTQSSRLVAKKTFDREFNYGVDQEIDAIVGPPHLITVTFGTDTGLYLLPLLARLQDKLSNGFTDFRFDYSNIRMVINPYAEAIPANILMVSQTSGTTWEITIDQDPTAVVGNVTDLQILYDYNNTVGLDVGEDMFGIATDNDDIDIRSGRDIDLIAADDITFRAGSTFDLTLLKNDFQAPDDGLEIITESSTLTNIWKFQFSGLLQVPGNIAGTDGIVITPANGETYAYLNLPSDANAANNGVAIGNDNGKIELRTTDQGTSNSYTWKFDNDSSLTFPDGTTTIGKTIVVPEGEDFNITLQHDFEDGAGPLPFSFSVSYDRITLPNGNGKIFTGSTEGNNEWALDAANKNLFFPSGDLILYNGSVANEGLDYGLRLFTYTKPVIVTSGQTKSWTFGTDGNLTVPGDIRSENAINIDINLSDSTTHTWRFGEDGHLNLPSGGGNIQSDGTIQLITGSSTVSVTDDVFGFSNTKNGVIALSLISGGVSIAASGNFAFSGDNFFATTTNNINFTSGGGITLNSPVTEVRGNNLILVGNDVDIQSEGNVNIDINLSDSTLRRWSFGEDGNLNLAGHLQFPNGAEIRQSSLGELRLRGAAGQAAQLQGLDTNGSVDSAVKALYNDGVGSFVTINTNIDASEHIWSFDYNGDLTVPNYINFAGNTFIGDEPGAGTPYFRINTPLGYAATITTDSDISGNNWSWTFGEDGNLTLPGELHGAPVMSVGPTPSQVGRTVNITPADDASDKKFRFRVDQYAGQTFTRAYLELPTAEVDKQVAAVFPHANGKAGFIYTQGNDTNGQGLNDAFNIFYNNGDIKITSMGSSGGFYTWKFGDSGDLTIPGNIQSESSINIDINLSDSTLRRWRFGEDGDLTFPDSTVQTTAFTGNAATVDITNTNGIDTNYSITFVETRDTTQILRADVDLTFNSATNLFTAGNVAIKQTLTGGMDDGSDFIITSQSNPDRNNASNIGIYPGGATGTASQSGFVLIQGGNSDVVGLAGGNVIMRGGAHTNGGVGGTIKVESVLKIDDGVHEKFQTKSNATGTVTHDCSSGHVFYHTLPSANWTVNLTNLNLAVGYATTVTLVIEQSATGYYPNAVQIDGNGVGLAWQGNTTPTPSSSRVDVVTFSILYDGLYTVLGQLTGF